MIHKSLKMFNVIVPSIDNYPTPTMPCQPFMPFSRPGIHRRRREQIHFQVAD